MAPAPGEGDLDARYVRQIDKEPPYSIEAEQAVLGAILIDRDAIIQVADQIVADDFYRRTHQIVYQTMLDLWEGGEPPDIVLLAERIEKAGLIETVGGRAYLASLSSVSPSSVHAMSYAKIIRRKSVLRNLINAAGKIAGIAYADPEDTDEAVDQAQEVVYQVATRRVVGRYTALRPLLMEAFDRIDNLYSHKGNVNGIATGFRDLDLMTQGFQNSDLVIIAARPSVGKTSFALNIAHYISSTGKKKACVFSLEMSQDQLVLRLLSSVSGIDSQKLRTGYLADADFQSLTDGLGELSNAEIYIDDSPSLSITELRTKARRMKMEVGMDILIVDYLQLMHAPGSSSKDSNRVQEVSAISRGLKTLARELDVPVIALSQLNRGVEGRESAEPRLSDLRESGSIEQDADLVVFLWRKKSDEDEATDDGEWISVKVAKNRNGPVGDFQLWFRKHQTRFYTQDDRYA